MTIQCDHPRPRLQLPGYVAPRMAWQVPQYIPEIPPQAALVIRQALQGVYQELSRQGQVRNVIALDGDLYAQPGSVISGVGNGETITLLPPGRLGYTDPVSLVLTDVTSPVSVVAPDGTVTSISTAGTYDFVPVAGTTDQYQTNPGGVVVGAVPTNRLLGRDTPGTGAVEYIALTAPLELDGSQNLRIAAAGITEVHLNASVAGAGLTGGAGTPLAVGAGTGITVAANDVGLTSMAAGTVKGRAIDAGSTGAPTDLSGVQQGQNLRRETFVVDSTSSGSSATYAVASTTTQIVFKLSGDLTIHGMTADATTFGKTLEVSFHDGFAGSVTFADESSAAGASLQRVACPGGIDLTLIAGEVAVLTYFDSRWRVVSLSKTVARRFPGAPIYDVMDAPFNASGSLAGDDTAAINAAIAAANAAPGMIYLGPAHRITGALDPITGNNITVMGRGEFNGGTILQVDSASPVDAFTLQGQYGSIERMWIVGNHVYSGGWGIVIDGGYRCRTDRVVISSLAFGVEIVNSVLTDIQRTHLGDLYGSFGFLAHGTGGNVNHAARFENCVCGTDFPAAVVGNASVWTTGTAYVTGNIVFANSAIYQAVSSGTSGATAPSGAGTTPSNAHTTVISDGGVDWVFAMPLCTWFRQDSYSQTFEVIDCGALQGGYGLAVTDSAPGAGSGPLFTRVQNFQADHCFSAGVALDAGAAIRMNQLFVTSVLEGSGVTIGSGVSGNWEFIGGEIFGCARAGMTIAADHGLVSGMQIGSCSLASSGTRDGIEVASGTEHFTIADCSSGTMFGASIGIRYGISVASGCDNYTIIGNRCIGNIAGGILNTPGRSSTRAVLNNIPDLTISAGSVWGLQVDASTGVPLEITGLEVGELLRRETFVTDSSSSGTSATYAIANTTTQVQFKLAGALTINGMTASSATFGKRVTFSFDTGFAGSVTWNNESGSAGAALQRVRTPGAIALTISAGDTAEFEYFDSRWRCVAVARGNNITDGDKGDITVSLNGTNWQIDPSAVGTTELANDAVTFAKMQNIGYGVLANPTFATTTDPSLLAPSGGFQVLYDNNAGALVFATLVTGCYSNNSVTLAKMATIAQSRIIGGAEGAGTATPTALTPTQVMSIVDGETVTWTGDHTFNGGALTANVTTADILLGANPGGVGVFAGQATTNVQNGDLALNATSGVGIHAGATPVTSIAAGRVALTADADITIAPATTLDVDAATIDIDATGNVTLDTPGNITIASSSTGATTVTGGSNGLTLTSSDRVNIGSPASVNNTIGTGAVQTSSTVTLNDVTLSSTPVLRLSGSGWTMTGMVPSSPSGVGQLVIIANVHASVNGNILIEASATAANRFAGPGTSRQVRPGEFALAWYDTTSSRWRLLSRLDAET